MRKLFASLLLAVSLSVSVLADPNPGDVPFPPAPPPCQQNCTGAAVSSPVPPLVVRLVLAILTSR